MSESEIQAFWQRCPCGESHLGRLENYRSDYETYFTAYDKFCYLLERHIPWRLDGIDFKGRHTLEIGLGPGADSEQIIRRGALGSGVDLTGESVNRVRVRVTLRNLPYKKLKRGSVLALPFADNSFDIVFSHGVLHHVPVSVERRMKSFES
jgi:SAM-dependent methyltransferase